MKVRLIVQMSGTRDGVEWPPMGNEMELPDLEARDMIAALQAIPVVEQRRVETATMPSAATEIRVATERPLSTDTGLVPGKRSRAK